MDPLSLLKTLVAFPSVTPDDAGCMRYIAQLLSTLGFSTTFFQYGEVTNMWAKRGHQGPHFCFIGHTDVVPPGPVSSWQHSPFEPWEDEVYLYGRGAVDMKGSIAAFLSALAASHLLLSDEVTVSVLLTSDEEGPADDGIRRVVPELLDQGEHVDYALVGEPVCLEYFGDRIKHGARGSLNGTLVIIGKQGHIAYDHQSPIAMSLPVIQSFFDYEWDKGTEHFPPTAFQVSRIHAGTGATNIVPERLEVGFNFRYAPVSTPASLQEQCMHLLSQHGIQRFQCHWDRPNLPYYSEPGAMSQVLMTLIKTHCDVDTQMTVGGATSDGRFLSAFATEIVEFGPLCKAAHQINECVNKEDLLRLTMIYEDLLRVLLIKGDPC